MSLIDDKYAKIGGANGFLGAAITPETPTPDGLGRFRHYQNGSIYWHPNTGAYEVHGDIRQRWSSMGWERSSLGYPVSDEQNAPDGGRISYFQYGSIRWRIFSSPLTLVVWDNLALSAPVQISPKNGTVYDIYPRQTILQWNPVPGATSYTVEIDCFHCCQANKWCADVGRTFSVVPNLTTTNYTFNFVGAQPGRWRVWAVYASGKEGPKSDWWGFSYLR